MEISLAFDGPVAVITWNDGENRCNFDSIGRLNEILDELDEITGPLALVVTGAGKFFSNGLDLERFGSDADEMFETIRRLTRLYGRFITYPAYSVGAINGHAFAGGAMMALTFDWRVMREDRGFWCINEVDLNMTLPPEMSTLIVDRLPHATAATAILTGRRFSAIEAVEAGVMEESAPESEVLARAVARAAANAEKNRAATRFHKKMLWGDTASRMGFDN